VLERDVQHALRRAVSAGGFPALVREVPELRGALLQHHVLLGGPVRLPLYVAALLAAAGRHRAAAVSAAAWAGVRWARLSRLEPSRGRRLLALPVDLGLDAIASAALVAGSVRARTAVL
jgi:hypothetical protein